MLDKGLLRIAACVGHSGRPRACGPQVTLVTYTHPIRINHFSTPAHCEKGKLAVEPDEQQALTYLNREREVF